MHPSESFWTERQLVDGNCPDCNRPVEKVREKSIFRMSKYVDWLSPITRPILTSSSRSAIAAVPRRAPDSGSPSAGYPVASANRATASGR